MGHHLVYKRISPPTLHRGWKLQEKQTLQRDLESLFAFADPLLPPNAPPPTGSYNHDIPLFSDIQTNLPFVFHKSGEICLSNHPKLLILICRNANNTSKAFPPHTSGKWNIIWVSDYPRKPWSLSAFDLLVLSPYCDVTSPSSFLIMTLTSAWLSCRPTIQISFWDVYWRLRPHSGTSATHRSEEKEERHQQKQSRHKCFKVLTVDIIIHVWTSTEWTFWRFRMHFNKNLKQPTQLKLRMTH